MLPLVALTPALIEAIAGGAVAAGVAVNLPNILSGVTNLLHPNGAAVPVTPVAVPTLTEAQFAALPPASQVAFEQAGGKVV